MDFFQPEGSYRFSSDAICTARYVCMAILEDFQKKHIKRPYLIMDIGCGCGVIGILVLQFFSELYPEYYPYLRVFGIEKEEELFRAAKYNAKIFGHEQNYFVFQLDVLKTESVGYLQNKVFEEVFIDTLPQMQEKDGGVLKNPRLFDFVVTNPPWYRAETKLHSVSQLRNTALFGNETILQSFFAFGEKFLKKNASIVTVAKTACYMEFMQAIPKTIQITAMQAVHKKIQHKAIFFILQGKYLSKAVFEILAPQTME